MRFRADKSVIGAPRTVHFGWPRGFFTSTPKSYYGNILWYCIIITGGGCLVSALTKTAVSYAGVFATLLLLLLPALGRGDFISDVYGEVGRSLFLLVLIAGALSFLFEWLTRKVNFPKMPDFTLNVSFVRTTAQLVMVTYLLSLVIKFDKWGFSYLLLAGAMVYTIVSRKKRKSETAYWLVNLCCSIVISSTFKLPSSGHIETKVMAVGRRKCL